MRISIDYNRHVYKRDAVYITAGLQTGIAFRYYRIGGNTKINNLAFSHFFFNCFVKNMLTDTLIDNLIVFVQFRSKN